MDRDKTRRLSCTKLSEKQVAAAAARHELLYSGRVGGARAVFAFCDLSGLDLSGRNLADADFTGAYLEETNLVGRQAGFGELLRRLAEARQPRGRLARRADMRGTSLRGANLIGADLYEADLREGNITEKGSSGELKVLQHDIGPSELPGRAAGLGQSRTRQADRRDRHAGRFHRRDHARLQADARQSAPRQALRRQSGKCRPARLRSRGRGSRRRHPGRRQARLCQSRWRRDVRRADRCARGQGRERTRRHRSKPCSPPMRAGPKPRDAKAGPPTFPAWISARSKDWRTAC